MTEILATEATLSTLKVEIKALTVSGKQMTLAVFRQLPTQKTYDCEMNLRLDVRYWGIVRYAIKDEGDVWVVMEQGGRLYRGRFYRERDYPYPDFSELHRAELNYRDALHGSGLWNWLHDQYECRTMLDNEAYDKLLVWADSETSKRVGEIQEATRKKAESGDRPSGATSIYGDTYSYFDSQITRGRERIAALEKWTPQIEIVLQSYNEYRDEQDAHEGRYVSSKTRLLALPQLFIAV